jgi:hypothetical protein
MGRVIKIGNESEDSFSGRKNGFAEKFWTRLRDSKNFFGEVADEWDLYCRTYAGDPWPKAARDRMKRTERPISDFNYVLTIVNSLLGSQMQERREIQFQGISKSQHDQQVAEWMTNLVRMYYARADGHRNESSSWLDTLTCGYGWSLTYVDSSRFPFRVSDEHIPLWEMFPDPDADDDGLSDARFVIRKKDWEKEEAKIRWPKVSTEISDLRGTLGRGGLTPKPHNKHVPISGPNRKDGVIPIYEYIFKKREPWLAYVDPMSGNRVELPEKDFEKEMAELQANPQVAGQVQPIAFTRDVCYQAYVGGDEEKGEVLQRPKMLRCDDFPYKCVTGLRERDYKNHRTRFFGIVKQLHPAQLTISKVSTAMIEQVSRQSKGNWLYEPGAILDPKNFKDNIATPGMPIAVADGAIAQKRIEETKSSPVNPAMAEMWRLAEASLPAMTGISEYSIGTATSERSNVLISNLQGQTMTTLQPLVDSLHSYRIAKGRVLAKFLQLYTAPQDIERYLEAEPVEGLTHQKQVNPQTGMEELVPIVDEQTGEPVTPISLIYDQDIMEYDVVVDTGVATVTEKQQLWQVLGNTNLFVEMMEKFPALASIADSFVRSLPGLPAADAERGAKELKEEYEFGKSMGQVNTMMQSFVERLDPQSQQQLFQQMSQFVQQQQMEQQQQQGGPPQGPPQQGGAPQ